MCDLDLIKRLRFYQDFDWNELIDLRIKPKFIPKVEKAESFIPKDRELMKYSDYLRNEEKKKEKDDYSEEEEEDLDEPYDADWAKKHFFI